MEKQLRRAAKAHTEDGEEGSRPIHSNEGIQEITGGTHHIVISRAKSTEKAGDQEKKNKLTTALLNTLDAIPAIGHAKGVIHYAVGDREGGHKAMKGATRTTSVVAGGMVGAIIGGPAGSVAGGLAGGIACDTVITGIDSTVHDTYRPHGHLNNVSVLYKNPADIKMWLKATAAVLGDGAIGYAAGKSIPDTWKQRNACKTASGTEGVAGAAPGTEEAGAGVLGHQFTRACMLYSITAGVLQDLNLTANKIMDESQQLNKEALSIYKQLEIYTEQTQLWKVINSFTPEEVEGIQREDPDFQHNKSELKTNLDRLESDLVHTTEEYEERHKAEHSKLKDEINSWKERLINKDETRVQPRSTNISSEEIITDGEATEGEQIIAKLENGTQRIKEGYEHHLGNFHKALESRIGTF